MYSRLIINGIALGSILWTVHILHTGRVNMDRLSTKYVHMYGIQKCSKYLESAYEIYDTADSIHRVNINKDSYLDHCLILSKVNIVEWQIWNIPTN